LCVTPVASQKPGMSTFVMELIVRTGVDLSKETAMVVTPTVNSGDIAGVKRKLAATFKTLFFDDLVTESGGRLPSASREDLCDLVLKTTSIIAIQYHRSSFTVVLRW